MNHPARRDDAALTAAKPIRVSNKWAAQALTFLMVFGPGLIVMEADNDAGAVSIYVEGGARSSCFLNDKEVLGERVSNKRWNNVVNWTIVIMLFVLSLLLAAQVAVPKLFPSS